MISLTLGITLFRPLLPCVLGEILGKTDCVVFRLSTIRGAPLYRNVRGAPLT
jgi:hypothetical protein